MPPSMKHCSPKDNPTIPAAVVHGGSWRCRKQWRYGKEAAALEGGKGSVSGKKDEEEKKKVCVR